MSIHTTTKFSHRGSLLTAEPGKGDNDVIRSRFGGKTGGPGHIHSRCQFVTVIVLFYNYICNTEQQNVADCDGLDWVEQYFLQARYHSRQSTVRSFLKIIPFCSTNLTQFVNFSQLNEQIQQLKYKQQNSRHIKLHLPIKSVSCMPVMFKYKEKKQLLWDPGWSPNRQRFFHIYTYKILIIILVSAPASLCPPPTS